jgi:glucose-6-phosphate-specific signal transduction histidine kinase
MTDAIDNSRKGFLELVYRFYDAIRQHEVRLVYEGKVTHQITKAIIALAEAQMEENEENSRMQRTVFHVMVECLQNISRHADDFETRGNAYSGKGIFIVSRTGNYWCITTGNAILKEKIRGLESTLAEINSLDEGKLKDLYKKQMREGRLSEKGGAGLGFIDIRRKTGARLDYHFLPLNEEASFFLLTTLIPG